MSPAPLAPMVMLSHLTTTAPRRQRTSKRSSHCSNSRRPICFRMPQSGFSALAAMKAILVWPWTPSSKPSGTSIKSAVGPQLVTSNMSAPLPCLYAGMREAEEVARDCKSRQPLRDNGASRATQHRRGIVVSKRLDAKDREVCRSKGAPGLRGQARQAGVSSLTNFSHRREVFTAPRRTNYRRKEFVAPHDSPASLRSNRVSRRPARARCRNE
jgi:hypothetical protein